MCLELRCVSSGWCSAASVQRRASTVVVGRRSARVGRIAARHLNLYLCINFGQAHSCDKILGLLRCYFRSMVARRALSSAMRSSVPVPDGAFEGVPRPSPSGKGKLDEETGKSTALPWSECGCFRLWVPYGSVGDDWGFLGGALRCMRQQTLTGCNDKILNIAPVAMGVCP